MFFNHIWINLIIKIIVEKIDETYTDEYFYTYHWYTFETMANNIAADAILRMADAEAVVQVVVDNLHLTQDDLNQFELNKHLRDT